MAEYIYRRESQDELEEDELREIEIEKPKEVKQTAGMNLFCSLCLIIGPKTALFLCYMCDVFLCEDCFKVHKHSCVRLQSERNERREKGRNLLMGMRSEGMRAREMEREKIEVFGRINVKHGLDEEDCWITGLCGLQNRRWVVLDSVNYCIKIFSSVTNTLLRYVRFGSKLEDVTEIKQKFTDPNSASGSKSGVSGAARGDQDKHCLLAVTFTWIKQIWFIDVNQTPATKTKTIKMQKQCLNIDFSDGNIFTLCGENVGFDYRVSVDILSTEGNPLKVIQVDFRPYILTNDLAVCKDKIYVADNRNNKVLCINVEDGKTISQLPIEGSREPRGICVDPSNNVYVCGWCNHKVYKLSPDSREFEPLNLDTDYTKEPFRICFTDEKLFISHYLSSPLGNFVTVVQLQ